MFRRRLSAIVLLDVRGAAAAEPDFFDSSLIIVDEFSSSTPTQEKIQPDRLMISPRLPINGHVNGCKVQKFLLKTSKETDTDEKENEGEKERIEVRRGDNRDELLLRGGRGSGNEVVSIIYLLKVFEEYFKGF